MLKIKNVKTKWNSKTKKYYESLGYVFTKMHDDLVVLVDDLPKNSCERVLVECDYCHIEYSVIWHHRIKSFKDCKIQKDACINCKTEKVKESLFLQFGATNLMQVKEYFDNQRKSCLDNLGFENPFQSEEVKEKIYDTNFKKYGKKSYTQTEEYSLKTKQTCLDRYGFDSHMKNPKYKEMFSGENSSVWKGGINDPRWERLSPEYRAWRFSIFQKNDFICQKCKIHPDFLEAHHIFNFKDYPELKYDPENGISFCINCHKSFHSIYGKKYNNLEQLKEFLK